MIPHAEVVGFSAALLMGFSGSAHCFGMCGGISGALGLRARHLQATSTTSHAYTPQVHALLYQLGRIAGYATVGAIFGAVGQALNALFDLAELSLVFRIASGVLLLLVAARFLLNWNGLTPLERAGVRLWKTVQPLTRYVSSGGAMQTFLLGMMWGLLPCGMVYSMLAFAALSGSALQGAALLALFGLGTAPAMFGATLLAAQTVRVFSSTRARRAAGILFAAFGVWMILVPIYLQSHAGQSGHIH